MYMIKERKTNSVRVMRSLYITGVAMVLTLLVLFLQFKSTESASTIAKPGCQESCGGIPIPYPFGIGLSCSQSEAFNLSCKTTYNNNGKPTPYRNDIRILNISLSFGQIHVGTLVSSLCYNTTSKKDDYFGVYYVFTHTYWVDNEKNKFTVIGCNTLAYLIFSNYSIGCLSSCNSLDTLTKDGSCSGIGCCQTAIPKGTFFVNRYFDEGYNNSSVYHFSPCSYAMVVEESQFKFDKTYITTDRLRSNRPGLFRRTFNNSQPLPMILNWAIGNTTCDIAQKTKSSYACISSNSVCLNSTTPYGYDGYFCNCSEGYEGNPYLNAGCQDIDECANQNACSKQAKCHNVEGGHLCSCPFGWHGNHKNPGECDLNGTLLIGIAVGIFALLFVGFGIYVVLERRNLSKVKQKHFQQHGGWILLEKMKSNQGCSFTIFTKQQLEQATSNFHSANILGQGGHGTVYRGTLRDQTVAIKKCTIVNESKKKEFGKEMLILSQINHRNIVKILGCCLEVEVPMLVYEFIPNGTLYHYIHHKKQGSHISLDTRVRIAHESAEALAYLHTSASPPIFHGDVKSANILLDQNYVAKVSDFGASILAPTDEVQFVTIVQGTCGYLDPEYMQSCQLTDKSDVYSFGVVLLELLTSKPVIDFDASDEARSLSSLFLSTMEENTMQELLDDEILHEDDMELIMAVAELAKDCLSMKGEVRPLMKEVAEELRRISKLKQHPWGQEYNPEETEILLSEQSHHDIQIEHAGNYFNIDKDAQESIAFGR